MNSTNKKRNSQPMNARDLHLGLVASVAMLFSKLKRRQVIANYADDYTLKQVFRGKAESFDECQMYSFALASSLVQKKLRAMIVSTLAVLVLATTISAIGIEAHGMLRSKTTFPSQVPPSCGPGTSHPNPPKYFPGWTHPPADTKSN